MHWEINNSLDILMHNREQALIKVRAVEKSQKIRPTSDNHLSPHHQKKCFSVGDLPRVLVV